MATGTIAAINQRVLEELIGRVAKGTVYRMLSETFTATAGQVEYVLTEGTYLPSNSHLFVYVQGIKQSVDDGNVEETASDRFTLLCDPADIPAGTKVEATWWEGVMLSVSAPANHAVTHEVEGTDPLVLAQSQVTGLPAAITTIQGNITALAEDVVGRGINVTSASYNVKGDGITDDAISFRALISGIGSTVETILLPKGEYRLASNVTIPSNITLWFMAGAMLSPDSGIIVTINGNIQAGLHKIFAGSQLIEGIIPTVYPEWFGALRDGVTDDSAAINQALHVIQTPGGLVKLSSGSYVANNLSIVGNNMSLIGSGMGTTKLINKSPTNHCINLGDAWAKLQINLADFAIEAPAQTQGTGIYMVNVNRSNVERVQIKGHLMGLYYGSGCFDVICNAMNISLPSINGIGLRLEAGVTGGGLYFSNATIDMGSVAGTYGIDIISGAGCYIKYVDIRQAGMDGLIIRPAVGQNTLYHFFYNVLGDTSGQNGIQITTGGGIVYGCTFVNCWGSTNGEHGTVVSAGAGTIDGIEFIGHRCLDNGQNGFLLQSGNNISIEGGTFSGNSQDLVTQKSGIVVASGVSGFKIQNTRCGQSSGRGNTQAIGIQVVAGTGNNYMITNNDVRGNVFAGIDDAGTGTNKVVANNLS